MVYMEDLVQEEFLGAGERAAWRVSNRWNPGQWNAGTADGGFLVIPFSAVSDYGKTDRAAQEILNGKQCFSVTILRQRLFCQVFSQLYGKQRGLV